MISMVTDRLLGDLVERIDQMEAGTRERLKADEIYQLSAQAAIRRMLLETNPRMADALARAVSELGTSTLLPAERLEIACALDALTELALHLLQTIYRAQNDQLTEQELGVVENDVRKTYHFTMLMYASMPLSSWVAPANELERAGMVVATLDYGWYDPAERAAEEPLGLTVGLRDMYPLGERVVRMCFDNPAVPAFGIFADQPPKA